MSTNRVNDNNNEDVTMELNVDKYKSEGVKLVEHIVKLQDENKELKLQRDRLVFQINSLRKDWGLLSKCNKKYLNDLIDGVLNEAGIE